MNKTLLFIGGFITGASAGVAGTYFFMKRKTEDYINEELEKAYAFKSNNIEDNHAEEFVEGGEQPIPELAEMAKKAQSENKDKTDYTGFSKSEEKGDEEVKKPIEYIDEEKAYALEVQNNYDIEEMTYYTDGVLAFDRDDSKIDPKELGIDISKIKDDELYVVDHSEQKVYAIVGIDESYKEMLIAEGNEENEEDEQSES